MDGEKKRYVRLLLDGVVSWGVGFILIYIFRVCTFADVTNSVVSGALTVSFCVLGALNAVAFSQGGLGMMLERYLNDYRLVLAGSKGMSVAASSSKMPLCMLSLVCGVSGCCRCVCF